MTRRYVPDEDLPPEFRTKHFVPESDLPTQQKIQSVLNPSQLTQMMNPWSNLPRFAADVGTGALQGFENLTTNVDKLRDYLQRSVHPSMAPRSPLAVEGYTQQLKNKIGLPTHTTDELLQGVGEFGALSAIPGASVPAITSRVAGGSLLSQDPFMGALSAGLGESVPLLAKGATQLAEHVNPRDIANRAMKDIGKLYESGVAEAKPYFEQLRKRFSKDEIYPRENNKLKLPENSYARNLFETKDQPVSLGSKIKDANNKFSKNPNYENAHSLTKILGEEQAAFSKLGRFDESARDKSYVIKQMRDKLVADMQRFLKSKDPQAAEQFTHGNKIYREKVGPFKEVRDLHKIATEEKEASPKKLGDILSDVVRKIQNKRKRFPDLPQHPLENLSEKYSMDLSRQAALKSLTPENVRKWTPGIGQFLQEPWTQQLGKNLSPFYDALKYALMGSSTNDNKGKP